MFLNIIPKELKNDIAKERHLMDASHMRLANWCRQRSTVLQHKTLAEIVKKNLTNVSRGKVSTIQPNQDESDSDVPPPPPPPPLAPEGSCTGSVRYRCSVLTTTKEAMDR